MEGDYAGDYPPTPNQQKGSEDRGDDSRYDNRQRRDNNQRQDDYRQYNDDNRNNNDYQRSNNDNGQYHDDNRRNYDDSDSPRDNRNTGPSYGTEQGNNTNKPRYGPGGNSTTLANNTTISGLPLPAPYDGTLVHTVAIDLLVVAMHVDTCGPTDSQSPLHILDSDNHLTDTLGVVDTSPDLFDNTNDVIPTCLYVLQPYHTSLPLITGVLAECLNHTDMSEIPLTGTLPSDSIFAAVHSTKANELLSLLVFKDERRTLQEYAPTTPASSPQSTGLCLAAHALLDTGSMAGDFVSKSLLVSLDALTHCYVSP